MLAVFKLLLATADTNYRPVLQKPDMTHSIKESRNKNPMWYFEHNYLVLSDMLDETQLLQHGIANFEVGMCPVELRIIEDTRYTLLIRIHQQFTSTAEYLSDIIFDVRLYQDAQLAEVLSYQGKARIQFKYTYPNENMFVPDEKRQGNLLLHDWLSMCSRLNYKETLIENCQR